MTVAQHANLAAGQWHTLPLIEQLGNADVVLAQARNANDARWAGKTLLLKGCCYRHMDSPDAAEQTLRAASVAASSAGDEETVLLVRVAEGTVAVARGNFPVAKIILDEVIASSQSPSFAKVRSRALHDLSTVAYASGDYEGSARLAFKALDCCDDDQQRERILQDLGVAFLGSHLYEAAMDTLTLVATAARSQIIRWIAQVNLLHVASALKNRELFETYRTQIVRRKMPPMLRAAYECNVGEGYLRFGEESLAREHLERGRKLAIEFGLHRTYLIAEGFLKQTKATTVSTARAVPSELERAAASVRAMLERVSS